MSSLAQEESQFISENTTWGQRKRFADGVMSLAYSNFLGYKKVANPGDMEIVEEEAVIIRRIYDEYLAGKSPGQIAKDLTADGIPTPGKNPVAYINGNQHSPKREVPWGCKITEVFYHIVLGSQDAEKYRAVADFLCLRKPYCHYKAGGL